MLLHTALKMFLIPFLDQFRISPLQLEAVHLTKNLEMLLALLLTLGYESVLQHCFWEMNSKL